MILADRVSARISRHFTVSGLPTGCGAGYVLVRNPYTPQAVTRYELNPDMVDLIGFCTKNPAPMLPKMDLLRSLWAVLVRHHHTLWA